MHIGFQQIKNFGSTISNISKKCIPAKNFTGIMNFGQKQGKNQTISFCSNKFFQITPIKLLFTKTKSNLFKQNSTPKLNLYFSLGNSYENYKNFQQMIKKMPNYEKMLRRDFIGQKKYYVVERNVFGQKGYTDGIYDCLAILLYNKENGRLFHISPSNYTQKQEIKHLQNSINIFISELQNKNQKCNAFIVGGQKGFSDNLYKNIAMVFKKRKILTDEIMYSKNFDDSSIYFNIPEKKLIINNSSYQNLNQIKEEYFHVKINQ